MYDALQTALWLYGCLTLLLLISTLGLWYERRQFAKRTGVWSSSPAWYIIVWRALTWPLWLPVYCVRTADRQLYGAKFAGTPPAPTPTIEGDDYFLPPVADMAPEVIGAEAEERGRQLLLDHLDDVQRGQLLIVGHFDVTAPSGNRYRLYENADSFNVVFENKALDTVVRLCCRPNGYLPSGDKLLAQMMLLLTDEAKFLRLSNRSVTVGGKRVAGGDVVGYVEALAAVVEALDGD